MQIIRSIQNRIYTIRGERVLLDFDLALLYEVETRVLNQTVKRNNKRFPADFMFQLTKEEKLLLIPQIEALNNNNQSTTGMSSQFVMTYPGKRPKTALPYAFTEQGIAMLSGLLNSEKAIQMNIAIMRAFVEIRRILLEQGDIKEQLKQLQQHITEHDVQLSSIYDAIENLLDEKAAQQKWNARERIGFNRP
ncbi:ORF6N domain-containing protein [Niabella beijingensis]|uniref:ORF6N domain-containing protein n=1 Tax=Niabella beijingensis TaxID=2872700 RepID=UPI001CBFFA41|nr:ORF6N domain-containing protein [Niabella beijingensis]MBZ4189603.1 ORF6N domain-containing protein [Niabella beijingensis]